MNEIWEDFKKKKEWIQIFLLSFFFLFLLDDVIIFLFKFHFDIRILRDFFLYSISPEVFILIFLFIVAFFPLIVPFVIVAFSYILSILAIETKNRFFDSVDFTMNHFFLLYVVLYFTIGPLIFGFITNKWLICLQNSFCFILLYLIIIFLCYVITLSFIKLKSKTLENKSINISKKVKISIFLFVLMVILFISNKFPNIFVLFQIFFIIPYFTFSWLFLKNKDSENKDSENKKSISLSLILFTLIITISSLVPYLDYKSWNNTNIHKEIFLNRVSFNLILNKIFLIVTNNPKFININTDNSIYINAYNTSNTSIRKRCIDKVENKELFLDRNPPVLLPLSKDYKIVFKSLKDNVTCVYALQAAGEKKNYYDLIDVGYIDP